MNEWLCTLIGIVVVAVATIPIHWYLKNAAGQTWREYIAELREEGEDCGLT